MPFVRVLKCRPAARVRASRGGRAGGGARGIVRVRASAVSAAHPAVRAAGGPRIHEARSRFAPRRPAPGAGRRACTSAPPPLARRRGGRGGARGTPSWHAVPDGVCLTPTVVWRRGMPPVALAVPGVGAPLIRARSTRSAAPRSVGGSAAGAQPAHLVTLVDKLHDVLAVAELHHSRGRRVQAARVGHQRWLGHAHQHHPLRRPLHHSPPSCWWCSAELKTVRAAKVCSSDFPRNKAPPQGNEPCRRDLHAREGRNAAARPHAERG